MHTLLNKGLLYSQQLKGIEVKGLFMHIPDSQNRTGSTYYGPVLPPCHLTSLCIPWVPRHLCPLIAAMVILKRS